MNRIIGWKKAVVLLAIYVFALLALPLCTACKDNEHEFYQDVVSAPDAAMQAETEAPETDIPDAADEADEEPADASDEQPQEADGGDGLAEEADDGEEVPEEPVAPFVNPLTGEPSEKDLDHVRPYCIMIDNGVEAVPQEGISYADILYEAAAYAGGATRCMGIFLDITRTPAIGGVRSMRSQFAEFAKAYDAILLHFGTSNEGEIRMSEIGSAHVEGMGVSWMYRDDWRVNNLGYTHSVLVDTAQATENMWRTKLRLEHEEDDYSFGMTFAKPSEIPAGTDSAANVEICVGGSKCSYFTYDEKSGVYLASQYDQAWIDHANGEQLSFTNLVLINMNAYQQDVYQIHKTTGEGTGYIFINGTATEIKWERSKLSQPFSFYYTDGTPVVFGIGKTYIGVCTCSGYIKYE